MIQIKVRIGTIDMDGYLGRDLHPRKEDGHKVAEMISLHQGADGDLDWVVVMMPDGRQVEIMEHEIHGFDGRSCVGLEDE